ncbi:glycosyltransferase family 39 protein [Clostridium sp. P21]|uniref:Glycosyltransferase family 39 protein n=1 Tax=Clostridium muellerianum TaxID=2716538 RepID=A0A7Y0EGD4_9CLOT|nr:glycosyltransferase family 39 protein [Clostridium muellerianum]NMM62917.1 glycosyltransferase family 39 protein [Clostridium muellerianum]
MKKKIEFTKENLALSLIVILSAVLNFANISIDGYGNQYYAAGVRSMTMSLKNFFFVSFDPSSFVTIDKPPLGFWIQAISAKIFGYSGWSILLPQALAGVISVVLIYHIVKRSFGSAAGLISALCLAVTPVFVAVSRNNTCDNLLVVTLLFACLALSKAAERGKVKYLLISLALVGVGFNIKMLQAYMIVPAIYLTYLLSNAVSIKKRIVHLTVASVVLLLVSFSWAFAVDLIPASSRPYVGSSTNNTEMELIIGHNGLERLGLSSSSTSGGGSQKSTQSKNDNGQMQAPPNGQSQSSNSSKQGTQQNNSQGNMAPPSVGMTPPSGDMDKGGPGGNGSKGGGGGTFGGNEKSSITRLFSNNSLSDQISWFLPLAALGFIAAAIKEKLKNPFDNKRKLSLILWSTWLLPEFIYFSFTKGLFHPYYLTMLAAPIAALTGIGIVSMWQLYKEGGWKSWILPISLILNGSAQMLLLYYYNTLGAAKILMIILSVLCFVSSVVLIILKLMKKENIKLKKVVLSLALIGLLVAPTFCSSTAIFYGMSGTFPSAGLSLMSQKGMGGQGMGSSNSSSNTKLIEFLKNHKTTEKYILVTSSTNGYASDIIIKTGESVMALGGFFGTDKVITLNEFKQLVSKGEVRYVMVGGMGGGNSSNDIMTWVKTNGKVVSESEWKNSSTTNKQTTNKNSDSNSKNSGNQGHGEMNSEQLYDLKGSVK